MTELERTALLTDHRLKQLEDQAVGSRATEREVDLLKLESATLKSLLVQIQTEGRERDAHNRDSLARLHERLDEITTVDAREQGARDERIRMWKIIAVSMTSSAAVAAVIVALLALLLHHG